MCRIINSGKDAGTPGYAERGIGNPNLLQVVIRRREINEAVKQADVKMRNNKLGVLSFSPVAPPAGGSSPAGAHLYYLNYALAISITSKSDSQTPHDCKYKFYISLISTTDQKRKVHEDLSSTTDQKKKVHEDLSSTSDQKKKVHEDLSSTTDQKKKVHEDLSSTSDQKKKGT